MIPPKDILTFTCVVILSLCFNACTQANTVVQTSSHPQIVKTSENATQTPYSSNTPTPPNLTYQLTQTPFPSTTTSNIIFSPTSTPDEIFTECRQGVCIYPSHFLLSRPIGGSYRDTIDPTYRYGSTQDGLRETHHGVEFVNSQGTPVLAAADGLVVVAGNDNNTIYSNWSYFYGNLVILKHTFPSINQPLFTLYGHLSKISVRVGQSIQRGEQVGLVGSTGTAVGSHLHFEVRLGKNDYAHTRNPDLWLEPHNNSDGQENGLIAGRIIDEFGDSIHIPDVVIKRLSEYNGQKIETYYIETYADSTVNGDNQLKENFALGDLPPGNYRVSFVARGLQKYDVIVQPGKISMIVFNAAETNTINP